MSFWSTLKSMCRSRERRQTRYTISITWHNGSGGFDCPISLPDDVANMLTSGLVPLRGEIWKHYGQPSDTTLGSMDRSLMCHLLFFPQSQNPVIGGSLVRKSQDFSGPLGGLNTLGGSSSLGSTPAPGQAPSSK
jgi:hypothetical protein